MIAKLKALLFPAGEDAPFWSEMTRQAALVLRLIAGLEIAIPLLMGVAGLAVIPLPISEPNAWLPNAGVVAVGVLTLLAAAVPAVNRRPRAAVVASVFLSAVVLEVTVLLTRPDVEWIDHFLIGYVTLVKLGSATLPVRPVQILGLGLAIDASYLVFWLEAGRSGGIGLDTGARQHLFTLATTVACTVLSGILFRQRASNYRAHQQVRNAEARLLISESAADMGRLAAALSHELNSPIGALASAVDTLATVALRCTNNERQRSVVDAARAAGKDSAGRLRSIVGRMQRFTNLDRADMQSVDVNDLLTDVAAIVQSEARGQGALVQLDLQPLPRFIARPQQLSAVFSNLIGNAVSASDGCGNVSVTTAAAGGSVRIEVRDLGPGMSEEELKNAFNPAWFHVSGKRVSAGYWSLFSCRQIIQEHGGTISIESTPGSGTTVSITLPVQPERAIE